MKQKGALSEEEFQLLRNNILERISRVEGNIAKSPSPAADLNQNSKYDENNSKLCSNSNYNSSNSSDSSFCKDCGTRL
ncbi:hypothetical protein NMY3_02681 [Candidatus Nitrosocosmicus oleophilus]|uniref:SHOCT domain-containing protein n=1 Tax=Candidatus Nitrosocosmicus oleophilus TaxID=1353260 RepID=A0A654M2U0_9ARCH|nr:hypothetical protein [Candidatus Nitrosocosmicus oleophilus]ALI36871.1 hypothetical protein NMY3_02681 [Candidatus Nitrosocosmicus oleophilus]